MLSLKLTLNGCILGCLLLSSFCYLIFAGKTTVEAIQKANTLDESKLISSSPAINRQALDQALNLLKNKSQMLSPLAASSSASTNLIASGSGVTTLSPKTVEIINASGVTGAAKAVSILFDEQKTNITTKNNQALLDETSIFYKNEYREFVPLWKKAVENLGWKVDLEQIATGSGSSDVVITLGKK
jgi:hypothetical protein